MGVGSRVIIMAGGWWFLSYSYACHIVWLVGEH